MSQEKNRLSVIITKGGDQGQTSLGGGQRVLKNSLRIEAYGTVDELNAIVGLVQTVPDLDSSILENLKKLQHDLFVLGSELCFTADHYEKYKVKGVTSEMIDALEALAEKFNKDLDPLEEFILPAGAKGAAQLHLARTVCRRAERAVVALAQSEKVRQEPIMYLNRLSDLFFIWSRWVLESQGQKPILWDRPR